MTHDPLCMAHPDGMARFLHADCDCPQIDAARAEGAHAERDRLANLPASQVYLDLIDHLDRTDPRRNP